MWQQGHDQPYPLECDINTAILANAQHPTLDEVAKLEGLHAGAESAACCGRGKKTRRTRLKFFRNKSLSSAMRARAVTCVPCVPPNNRETGKEIETQAGKQASKPASKPASKQMTYQRDEDTVVSDAADVATDNLIHGQVLG